MEGLDMMDWMLAEAKKKPTKMSHDFNTRFRVWVEQIIPARVNAIRQCKGDVEYAMRMVRLTLEDVHTLHDRAVREWVESEYNRTTLDMRWDGLTFAMIEALESYSNEVKQ